MVLKLSAWVAIFSVVPRMGQRHRRQLKRIYSELSSANVYIFFPLLPGILSVKGPPRQSFEGKTLRSLKKKKKKLNKTREMTSAGGWAATGSLSPSSRKLPFAPSKRPSTAALLCSSAHRCMWFAELSSSRGLSSALAICIRSTNTHFTRSVLRLPATNSQTDCDEIQTLTIWQKKKKN